MPNFPGNRVYPIQIGMAAARDVGTVTTRQATGLARGGILRDFNANIRGLGRRIDRVPRRPYP